MPLCLRLFSHSNKVFRLKFLKYYSGVILWLSDWLSFVTKLAYTLFLLYFSLFIIYGWGAYYCYFIFIIICTNFKIIYWIVLLNIFTYIYRMYSLANIPIVLTSGYDWLPHVVIFYWSYTLSLAYCEWNKYIRMYACTYISTTIKICLSFFNTHFHWLVILPNQYFATFIYCIV